ncbi:hypothetical protein PSPO01_02543 [Paraphaeosphaeria sporulosa]
MSTTPTWIAHDFTSYALFPLLVYSTCPLSCLSLLVYSFSNLQTLFCPYVTTSRHSFVPTLRPPDTAFLYIHSLDTVTTAFFGSWKISPFLLAAHLHPHPPSYSFHVHSFALSNRSCTQLHSFYTSNTHFQHHHRRHLHAQYYDCC